MCGRFTITVTIGLPERFKVIHCDIPLLPRYNIAPSQPVPVIVHPSGAERVCEVMTWGLVPSSARDPGRSPRPINARAESLHERQLFRPLLESRRCLVPATGFYEWVKTGKGAVPYYIRHKDESLFAFAGLYDLWKSGDGQFLKTFAVITTRPNPLVARYHDRMPAILPEENESRWLDSSTLNPDIMAEILVPYPEERMTAYRVSPAVNDPRTENPLLIRQVDNCIS